MEDKHFCFSDNVITREVGDELVLLNLQTHQYYSLNQMGARMVHLLKSQLSIEQAVELLHAEYSSSPEQIRVDIETLVKNLQNYGLIEGG